MHGFLVFQQVLGDAFGQKQGTQVLCCRINPGACPVGTATGEGLHGAELIPLLPRAPWGHKETNVQTPGRAVPADPAEVGTCGDGGPWFVSYCLLKWLCSPLPQGEECGVTQGNWLRRWFSTGWLCWERSSGGGAGCSGFIELMREHQPPSIFPRGSENSLKRCIQVELVLVAAQTRSVCHCGVCTALSGVQYLNSRKSICLNYALAAGGDDTTAMTKKPGLRLTNASDGDPAAG